MQKTNLIVLILFSLVVAAPVVVAQEPEVTNDSKLRVETKKINGKKVRVLKGSKSLTSVVPSPKIQAEPTLCEIDISTDYWQANDKVKMDAYIDTPDCGEAHGSYSVSIRTKNEADEYRTREFPEAWSRDNAEPLKLSHSYGMTGDSDLVKVRVKLSAQESCVCGVKESAEQK